VYSDIAGDSLIGGYLHLSPEFGFVVEENDFLCGFAFAALDAKQFQNRMETVYMPELCLKYPENKSDVQGMTTQLEVIVSSFHQYKARVPDEVHKHFPSLIKVVILPTVSDSSIVKKLVSCVLAALKANGSFGVCWEVEPGDLQTTDLCTKLGFLEINQTDKCNGSMLYYGKAF